MAIIETLATIEDNCNNCKFRGASFRDVKCYCNRAKMFVAVQRCKHYEKEAIVHRLEEKSAVEREVERTQTHATVTENESLNKIVDFFVADCEWVKLRRILTKDIISTTVLLNYLEHNIESKKKFMGALIEMAQKELREIDYQI